MPLSSDTPRKKRQRKPKHALAYRAYRYRVETTPAQFNLLHTTLDTCHNLRNQLVEAQQDKRTQNRERRAAGHTVTFKSRAQWFKWQQGLLSTQSLRKRTRG